MLTRSRGTGPPAFIDQAPEVNAGQPQRGRKPHQHGRQQDAAGGEQEHVAIHGHCVETRQILRTDGSQDANGGKCQARSQKAAEATEHQALSHQLARHSPASRSQSAANGNLPRARQPAREQQIGHVQAGNQQQNYCCCGQHQDGGTQVAHHALKQWHDREPRLPAILVASYLTLDDGHLSLEPVARVAGVQSYIPFHIGQDVDSRTRIDLGPHLRTVGKFKSPSGHADNSLARTADKDHGTDNLRVRVEGILPDRVTEHRLIEVVPGLETASQESSAPWCNVL